jgi:cobyrinic acid a,c-diamide synthase
LKAGNQVYASLIAAPASGQGKTLVTAVLARAHRQLGRQVRCFKCGPDFLDPKVLEVASGAPVANVDLGMCGLDDARWRLAEAAQAADVVLVEGVMGLFDGTPSAADLAKALGLPVLLVIEAGKMAQTFAAVAHGLATFDPALTVWGVVANRVAGPRHQAMLAERLPPSLPLVGALAKSAEALIPERHLGLYLAEEIGDLDQRLDRLAEAIRPWVAEAPWPAVRVAEVAPPALPPLLPGWQVAVARDAAFAFRYPANEALLTALGATLRYFSPIADEPVPSDANALWLPGGYPERFAKELASADRFRASLVAAHRAGLPILAECGGMMVLAQWLELSNGARFPMAGLLPGTVVMQPRLAALGTQRLVTACGMVTGHTFHYSQWASPPMAPVRIAERVGGRETGEPGEALYRCGSLLASYIHWYFPSAPEVVAAWLRGLPVEGNGACQ